VSHKGETPFDNIEGSHEYVRMLAEAVNEARRDAQKIIEADPTLADPSFARIRRMVLGRFGHALDLADVG